MEQIVVTFNDAGDPVVSAHGVKGAGCKAFTKAIEAALGATASDKKTGEFFEEEQEEKVRARRNA